MQRGVGQRVFQAVLRYISLYPSHGESEQDRIKALEMAKEDQYAMKIIPKLKGIHLHSEDGKRCMQKFREIIPQNLQTDDLMLLPGIGETMANRIIEARPCHPREN